jgi:HlyD family secretion protein
MTANKEKTKKKNRLYWYIGGGLVLLIVVLAILSKTGVLGKSDVPEIQTEKILKKTIREVISASGKLKPEKEVSISSDVSGEIIELTVKEGDKVFQGQLLLRIKPDEYQSMVEDADAAYNTSVANMKTAKSNMDQMQAMFNKAKAEYDRYVVLKQKNAVSATDFENVESQYLSAKAQLESARQNAIGSDYAAKSADARKRKAYENLRKTSIYSPIDGIVTKLNSQLGERVVGTAQMMGTVVMKLADLNLMVADIDVNENDIIRIEIGDTADIEVDAFIDKKFQGIVTEIANSSKESASGLSDQITTFSVKIRLLESSYKALIDTNQAVATPFRPGMSAMVDINTNTVSDVIAAPILAVTTRDKNKQMKAEKKPGKDGMSENDDELNKNKEKLEQVVFLYDNGIAKMIKVESGIQDDNYIQIKSGLKEGDEVISGPYSTVSKLLKDGKTVKKTTKPAKN